MRFRISSNPKCFLTFILLRPKSPSTWVHQGASWTHIPAVWSPSASPPLQVTVEDFEVVCRGLYRALCIREKNMQQSLQRFPKTPSQYLRTIEGEPWKPSDAGPGTARHPRGFLCPQQGRAQALAQAPSLVSQWWGVPACCVGWGSKAGLRGLGWQPDGILLLLQCSPRQRRMDRIPWTVGSSLRTWDTTCR